jgi:hypothetical protein
MKKRILIVLIISVLLLVNVTFAYMYTTFNSNNVTIKVGQPDGGVATLTPNQGPAYVLIPVNSIATKSGETTCFDYTLNVQTSTLRTYTISHNLPVGFELVTLDHSGGIYQTNTNYTIRVTMTQSILTDQVFYILIELI